MTRLMITPWRHPSDLIAVRQQLYRLDGDKQDNRQYAVDRIMAWKLRSNNLPHAVESTALLVDAFNHHRAPGNSSFSIRAVYSAAFCRFVTGYCDIGRNRERSLEPSSMLEIARQIDMPIEFVALRHEATHEELPSEQRLVAACEDALHWLWTVYWSRLDSTNEQIGTTASVRMGAEDIDQCRDVVRRLFKDHRTITKAHLKTTRTSQAQDANALVLRSLNSDTLPAEAYELAAKDVIDKGLLIPSQKGLRTSSMEGAYLLWDDLLHALDQQMPRFFVAIVDALLATLIGRSPGWEDAAIRAHCAWLLHLGCSESWRRTRSSLASHIVRFCVLHNNSHTSQLCQDVLSEADDDDDDLRQEWEPIFKASLLRAEPNGGGDQVAGVAMRDAELDEDGIEGGGWRRAVLAPGLPIGVCSS